MKALHFEVLKNNHVVPKVYMYTMLINIFCKIRLIHQAYIWVDEMKRMVAV